MIRDRYFYILLRIFIRILFILYSDKQRDIAVTDIIITDLTVIADYILQAAASHIGIHTPGCSCIYSDLSILNL